MLAPSTLTLPAGPVSQGTPGTASAVLFLGKLQRTLQRTRAQVGSRGEVGLGSGLLLGGSWGDRPFRRGGGEDCGGSPCSECRTCYRQMGRTQVARSPAWR